MCICLFYLVPDQVYGWSYFFSIYVVGYLERYHPEQFPGPEEVVSGGFLHYHLVSPGCFLKRYLGFLWWCRFFYYFHLNTGIIPEKVQLVCICLLPEKVYGLFLHSVLRRHLERYYPEPYPEEVHWSGRFSHSSSTSHGGGPKPNDVQLLAQSRSRKDWDCQCFQHWKYSRSRILSLLCRFKMKTTVVSTFESAGQLCTEKYL